MTNEPIDQALVSDIMAVVRQIGDPLMRHITKRVTSADESAVKDAVRRLVASGDLRMKEDPYDHEWAYIMTRQGREKYGKESK